MYEEIDDDERAYAPVRTKARARRKERGRNEQVDDTQDSSRSEGTRRTQDSSGRRGPTRAVREGRESFKCVHCRAFIGPTISGGKHRNHCPLCLYSRHVDGKRPGDRASDCNAKMAPIGRFTRSNGEPMVVHRCLGCGFERNNRLAADDNMLLFEDLPIVGRTED